MNKLFMLGFLAALQACQFVDPAVTTPATESPSTNTESDRSSHRPASTPAATESSDHEEIITALQTPGPVIPPAPKVHPLTATYNREAIIPPMCYTRTEGKHNPCYVCHQNPREGRENTMADGELQLAYSFSDLGMTNHWKNLFEDRSDRVAAIGDHEILQWVEQDNYSELAGRLQQAGFKGWIPDLQNLHNGAGAFDRDGIARDHSHWVAFNYKPFPSTFWPTNGSTDDVMIRLPEPYRTNRQGKYSRDVYLTNLSIVEMNIKGLDTLSLPSIDGNRVGEDLDGDGRLGVAKRLKKRSSYVGAAHKHVFFPAVYPMETEFLHTVRYLGFAADGEITVSTRMKEVRYMKKWQAVNHQTLAEYYREEGYHKDMGLLPAYTNLHDYGLDNGMGWSIQGFIEDRNGRLRVSTYEENLFCMGCHASIGATIDKTFSFPRKVDGAVGWGYINLRGMKDAPTAGESRGEIRTYFERAGGGDEFRSNPEMLERWFNPDHSVNTDSLDRARDVHDLITPSRERALQLNKAYRVIVDDQDFVYGRDATVSPPKNVYDKVDNDTAPTLPEDRFINWNIVLDWSAPPAHKSD